MKRACVNCKYYDGNGRHMGVVYVSPTYACFNPRMEIDDRIDGVVHPRVRDHVTGRAYGQVLEKCDSIGAFEPSESKSRIREFLELFTL